jgi:hypothetical protein
MTGLFRAKQGSLCSICTTLTRLTEALDLWNDAWEGDRRTGTELSLAVERFGSGNELLETGGPVWIFPAILRTP